ncbi:hypothetical protein [Myxococcus sp. RHSTA-1-4]|uniref:hypothetical protein n=1 Tax=Myxococcus sp. RHSTA-1-4 TaxID=2874601 RepID=UPI001CC1175D|nr:hypothetical protein [Myxococcus sp. RHSTA-1-4]MBZ4418641.1 hypothetical protein [Myxococcus sp. RHSTA-1-4]
MTAVAVLLAALLAQAPSGPGPEGLTLPGYRLHLVVDESVDADTLRALAGGGTVLWLRTRSNMLRDSTVEAVALFPEAYVLFRPPLLEAHAEQLRRAPRAGAWVDAGTLGKGAGWHHRLGPRPVAVDVRGPLDAEVARRVAALRPARVTWMPGETDATLAGWGELAQLPGAKVLVLAGAPGTRSEGAFPAEGAGSTGQPGASRLAAREEGALSAGDATTTEAPLTARACPEEVLPVPLRAARTRVTVRVNAGTPVDGPPCGMGRRVRVSGPPDDAALVALFSRVPDVELELEVGAGPAALANARRWVERLEAAVRGNGSRQ